MPIEVVRNEVPQRLQKAVTEAIVSAEFPIYGTFNARVDAAAERQKLRRDFDITGRFEGKRGDALLAELTTYVRELR